VIPTGRTKVFTILAHPSTHVVAPAIYNHIFSSMGLDMIYIAHDVAPDAVADTMNSFSGWINLGGFNVTIPHKESVVASMKSLCEVSSRIGVVNTVVRHEDGTMSGYNTDGLGAASAIGEVHGDTCLVIGAGGAARAIVEALIQKGARRVLIMNRSSEGAHRLCEHLRRDEVSIYQGEPLEDISVVVQATPMAQEIPLGIEVQRFKKHVRILETIMRPTALSKKARLLGFELIPGYAMLYHQTRRNFELLTGLELPVKKMDEAFASVGYLSR
jgi:shikimate dehydrogenase